MPRRSVSPAQSDFEVDIAGDLFGDDADAGFDGFDIADSKDNKKDKKNPKSSANDLDFDFGDILNAGGASSSEDDGDAAFIASKLRGANRKSSNLQGKTVKKGGGFQAMGMFGVQIRAIDFTWNKADHSSSL